MSINDFEYVDDEITSKTGNVVSKYLTAKTALENSVSDAVASSYDFGYSMGAIDLRQKLLEWIENNRTAIELDAGMAVWRDHFTSEDLIEFIIKATDSVQDKI
jgi:hypothetical protein